MALAQQERFISGRITDTANDEPVPGAAVFFDNTTAGTTTDADGQYRLKIPGQGSYRLTVSHVGYQAIFIDIEPNNTSTIFNVALQSIELDEVTVTTKVRFRQTDINLFWRTILGKNPSRRTIQATNPENVYYFYNTETRILTVTCREPLQIINYETGYQIQYVLNHFTHDYNTGFTDWRYQSVFTELEPQNPRQKDTWGKNRKEVYDISLTKFIKSLYNNTLKNDGFVLANFDLSLVDRDEILQTNPVTNSKTINTDGLFLLICYGKPVTDRNLARLQSLQQNSQQTPVKVLPPVDRIPGESYSLSIEEQQRREAREISSYRKQQLQQMENMIAGFDNEGKIKNMLQGDSIRIYPDGTFTNTLSMGRVNNSASLMGLGMRLPVEYLPDDSSHSAIADVIAENGNDFDQIVLHFDRQLSVFPQEKIHLHTDRDFYVPGEKIWFKAYVVDAHTHTSIDSSRYVYAELISPTDTLVSRVMIRPENNMYYGHLFLSEIVPEGNYTLRAYTRYMENLGDDYFFKKNIRIGNIKRESTNARKRESVRSDYEVSFFPEGGNLVEGVWNKVAFKALNRNGYAEMIAGTIVDETGAEITSVQTLHAGMGVFTHMPEQGKRHYLKCRNGNGLEKRFELPQANPRACALAISQNNNRISVGIRKSSQNPDSPLFLLAQCRGEALYFSEWDQKNEHVSFVKEGFPSGIIQFVLFDAQMNPVSERLVFNKNDDEANVDFQTNKASYEKREKVTVTLTSPLSGIDNADLNTSEFQIQQAQRAAMQLTLSGHFSVSITDDADIAIDSTTTILSSLLLSSELKGYIENPAWYLKDNIQSTTALDYLMMTHGWRRYNIPEVIKGNTEVPEIPFQTGQQISGKVRGFLFRPVAGSEVLIVAEEEGYGLTTTDEKGIFMFQDFEYPDSASFMIQALSRRGSSNVELVLDEEPFPKLVHAPQTPVIAIATNTALEEGEHTGSPIHTNAFIAKAEQRARYDEDMRVVQLGVIEVSAPRIDRKEERRLEFWANRSSDFTVRREEIERVFYSNTAQYLTFVPGVRVSPNPYEINEYTVFITGMNGSPLLLVDGMEIESLSDISPVEVESIDILKIAGATMAGMRGAGGVISITTRTGGESNEIKKVNQTVYTPLGYQKPVEF
ncbi:MAG: carboxypeptidase-like regulatory domain-containing protein, partial [Tannerella sp.]|nr:carboxypeptidase-like regulatory domain-containing protein [Tannerella sp.]